MSRHTRLHLFLDRFEERLEVDCERLKRQLLAQFDERFGFIREKVSQLRDQFCCGGQSRSVRFVQMQFSDDPPVETVQLDQWLKEQSAQVESSGDVSCTSNDRKRKSSSTCGTVTSKRHKTGTVNDGPDKHQCKSAGCDKSFVWKTDLARHELIHLGVKPFSCNWPDCRYSSTRKGHVVVHVRTQHFKLPKLQKDQTRLNIVDNRNPEDYDWITNCLNADSSEIFAH